MSGHHPTGGVLEADLSPHGSIRSAGTREYRWLMLSSWLETDRFGGKSQRRDATTDRFAPWWWWWWWRCIYGHSIMSQSLNFNLATRPTENVAVEKIVTFFCVSHARCISVCSLRLMYLDVFVRVDTSLKKIWPSAQVACFQRLCQSLLCEFYSVTFFVT